MWYLIFILLFGNPSGSNTNSGQTITPSSMETPDDDGDNGGETSTPIPPRPPKP